MFIKITSEDIALIFHDAKLKASISNLGPFVRDSSFRVFEIVTIGAVSPFEEFDGALSASG